MKRIRQFIVLFLAGLFLLSLAPLTSSAEEMKIIRVPFISLKKTLEWDFPYSDDFFTSSGELSLDLAKASFGLSVSAFRNDGYHLPPEDDLPNQYETYLKAAGFTDISAFGYDMPTSPDSLSGVIAQKKIGDDTLIAAVPCGQGYQKEWAGNFEIGNGDIHEGFSKAADIFEEKILSYMQEHKTEGKKKLWLSGFSKSAAVSNITAARMIDSGMFEDVFAYLFAVPKTTRKPENSSGELYSGIYNFCGKNDLIPQIPLECWGFSHYGITFYTPAEEYDTAYAQKVRKAADIYSRMAHKPFYNNPEVNHQLHMIAEFFGELFPTQQEYVEKLQTPLMDVMETKSLDNMLLLLINAVEQMENLDRKDQFSSRILINYLSYMMFQHLGEEDKQVTEGRWNPDASISENLMREHMPAIYLSWIFSFDNIQDLVLSDFISRTVNITADADAEVWIDGELTGGAYRDGTIRGELNYAELDGMDPGEFFAGKQNVCLIRNGPVTNIVIPSGISCDIVLRTDDTEYMTYYQVFRSPYLTLGWSDEMALFQAEKGEYKLHIQANDEILRDFEAVSGTISSYRHFARPYSPISEMAEESGTADYISFMDLLLIAAVFAAAVLLILAVCLGIFIAHAIGKRKKGKTYSDWYVIIPHLVLIVLFTLMSRFFSVHVFSIGIAREICSSAAMLLIFLLALRGAIRFRNAWNLSVAGFLLILNVLNFFLQKSVSFSGSARNFVFFCLAFLALTLLALSTFYIRTLSRSDRNKAIRHLSPVMSGGSAVLGEMVLWLVPSDPLLRTVSKIIAGVFLLVFALSFKKQKGRAFLLTFTALFLCCTADVVANLSFPVSMILFALAHVCLIILFQKSKKLSRTLWILWAVVSAVSIALILIFGSGKGLYAYGAAAYAPVILLMFFSAINRKGALGTAGCLFVASDCLLAVYFTWHIHWSVHVLYMALYYAALFIFAAKKTPETGAVSASG